MFLTRLVKVEKVLHWFKCISHMSMSIIIIQNDATWVINNHNTCVFMSYGLGHVTHM